MAPASYAFKGALKQLDMLGSPSFRHHTCIYIHTHPLRLPTDTHTHTWVVWLGIHPVCVQKVPKRGLHLTSNRAPFIMSRTRAPLPSDPLHHHPDSNMGFLQCRSVPRVRLSVPIQTAERGGTLDPTRCS